MFIAQAAPAVSPSALPEWAIPLIAAGTIVAAVIAAVNAFVVALVQTRAQRTRAIDEAHRGYRRELAAPYVAIASDLAAAASELEDIARIRMFGAEVGGTDDQLRELEKRLNLLPDEASQPVIGDELMNSVRSQLNRLRWDLSYIIHVLAMHENEARATVVPAAQLNLRGHFLRGATQLAAEAYMFDLRKPAASAKRVLKTVREFAEDHEKWRDERDDRVRAGLPPQDDSRNAR